jgi:hypothetical protein
MRRIITSIIAVAAVSLVNIAAQAQEAPATPQPVAYHLQHARRTVHSRDFISNPYINRDLGTPHLAV